MATDLGYSGIAQKYFLASITSYQTEIKKLSWQMEGSGKHNINTSMKAVVLAIGSKLMDNFAQVKEWRNDDKVQHKELLTAVAALELAITKLHTVGSVSAVPPNVGASEGSGSAVPPNVGVPNLGVPAPSTYGVSASEILVEKFIRQPRWEECLQKPCKPRPVDSCCFSYARVWCFISNGSTRVPTPGKEGLACTCPHWSGCSDPRGLSRRDAPR